MDYYKHVAASCSTAIFDVYVIFTVAPALGYVSGHFVTWIESARLSISGDDFDLRLEDFQKITIVLSAPESNAKIGELLEILSGIDPHETYAVSNITGYEKSGNSAKEIEVLLEYMMADYSHEDENTKNDEDEWMALEKIRILRILKSKHPDEISDC
eukprot:Gregarina_sp_Poly_1__4808@NODE_2563_length_1977_cov_102_349738_g1629_i0_p2_GENE_NODE_2563_length_1977_cov_102_349738_g1629_i0NODE_2563_length_1977_cov_102_349738_g1629_i0_p2_ORF_typecomplete_len157_score24_34Na_Ca_ex_C/PF16494_5/0_12Peptidase_M99_C/PF17129_4/0_14_NODE_2563_length_1977_cov_102_349738_g1629_i0447917